MKTFNAIQSIFSLFNTEILTEQINLEMPILLVLKFEKKVTSVINQHSSLVGSNLSAVYISSLNSLLYRQ